MQQRTAIIAATVLACVGVGLIGIVATAEAQEKFTGCLKDNGRIVRVAPGENPTKPCKKKQTQIMFPGTETTDALMEKDAGRVRFVFASSTRYQGDIPAPDCTSCSTGIERARFECNRLAAAVGLPGEYEPWLSDEDSNVVDRFEALGADGPWFNLAGLLVAPSLQALLIQKGQRFLYNSIRLTEQGEEAFPPGVWTGTTSSGGTATHPTSATCQGWTTRNREFQGLVGLASANGAGWTALTEQDCNGTTLLYCFQR